MRKQSAVDRGRNKPRSVSVSASWRSVATLFSRPTKPLRFTPLASNHRSTDTGSVGPASIANTIASTTDSRGAPCSAFRLWNSHDYRALCLQVQIFVGKDKSALRNSVLTNGPSIGCSPLICHLAELHVVKRDFTRCAKQTDTQNALSGLRRHAKGLFGFLPSGRSLERS